MQLSRRQLLFAMGAVTPPFRSRVARAQAYPARPIHWIVGQAGGSMSDIGARELGQRLSVRLGEQVVIENRPDDSGNTATEAVVHASPDGYTFLVVDVRNTINLSLYDKLNFNFLNDIVPVASTIRVPLIMEVNPSFPAQTVPEFIAYAKANPGKVSMASPGVGSSQHIAGELFKFMAGIEMAHVPFRGTPAALNGLMGGQVQVMFASALSSNVYIRSGLLRPLAVTSTTRLDLLPDVRPVADFVPGYEASTWFGIGAPKGTPSEVIDKLNKEINAVLADSESRTKLSDLGSQALPGSPADFAKLIADEADRWGKLIQASGMEHR